jgi:hypothetical protein
MKWGNTNNFGSLHQIFRKGSFYWTSEPCEYKVGITYVLRYIQERQAKM